jgi:hypothetical protein
VTGPIAAYLAELDRFLAFDPGLSGHVRDEIASHLFETAERVGEADAVRRFGQPAEIARAYALAALPDRLRQSCVAAALLGGATLALMWLRTAFLNMPLSHDPLAWFDRLGIVAAMGCVATAWWIGLRRPIGTVQRWLHGAAGCLTLSIGSSLARALHSATDDPAVALIIATMMIELLLLFGLKAQLAQLDRYARRLAR